MNAAEVIENIKKLPPDEQRRVFNFVEQHERASLGLPPVRYATDEEFRSAANHVFEKHDELFRNLAVSERAERESTLPGSSV